MPTLHGNTDGVLIALNYAEETVPNSAVSISFDRASNTALVDDIMANADAYRLLPGPVLQKDGVDVPVDTMPVPTGIRRAIQILTEQEAAIAAATTLVQVKAVLEQDRVILRRLLIRMGED
jgi:hypothetical protein